MNNIYLSSIGYTKSIGNSLFSLLKGFVLKKVINLNGDSRFTSPPSYSGWLGSCWFEEGKTEDRLRYIEQIKSEKISKIKSNNLVLESVSGNLIKLNRLNSCQKYSKAKLKNFQKEGKILN